LEAAVCDDPLHPFERLVVDGNAYLCLAVVLGETEVPIGPRQLTIFVLIRKGVKKLEIGLWSDGLIFLNGPTLLSLGANHRIKSPPAHFELHRFCPRSHGFRCPPLVEKLGLCICVPHHVSRSVKLFGDRNRLCIFVNYKFHIYSSFLSFFMI